MEGNNITQRVYFDGDNEIVVESDHGIISKGEDHVQLTGKFVIEANDVAKLLASHYKLNVSIKDLSWEKWDSQFVIISDLDIIRMVSKLKDRNEKHLDDIENWKVKCREAQSIADNLDKNITAFNASRRFYERKLKVKDFRPFNVLNPLNWQK